MEAVSLSLSGAGGVVFGLKCFHAFTPFACKSYCRFHGSHRSRVSARSIIASDALAPHVGGEVLSKMSFKTTVGLPACSLEARRRN